MLRLYVGATRQNDGKTVVSLGLINAFQKRFKSIGYMKPVGQHYQEIDGQKIDKDAVLMKAACGLEGDLADMSPIAIPRGFTREYILNGAKVPLANKVFEAYQRIADGKDMVLFEGTGHAGVGAVFNMSNSDVASLLDTPVLLVSCGGIGRPIDEIMLNKAMFDMRGVRLAGVIINKMNPQKYDRNKKLVAQGLARKGIDLLGVIPFKDIISHPTLAQLLDDIDGVLLSNGEDNLDNIVARIVIGAMAPRQAFEYLGGHCLLITPGNREDLILAALSGSSKEFSEEHGVTGIILTCGIEPYKTVKRFIKKSSIPIILVKEDTFTTASRIDQLIVKIRSEDVTKINLIDELVENCVDIDRLLTLIKKKG